MEPKKKSVIYWHPAFFANIQIELKDEADKLTFENEHHLSKKPMQIDVLIIKKEKAGQIRKNIGKIFKKHNVIEYKSPGRSLGIDDFYKVYGYACFYSKCCARRRYSCEGSDNYICIGKISPEADSASEDGQEV